MERILALSPVPSIILDADLRIIEISKSYLDITNFVLAECVGLDVYDFIEAKVPAPDVASMRHAIETAIAIKGIYDIQGIHGASGSYWRARTIPIFDGDELLYVVLEAQDTTEEHSKLEALNEQLYSNETYRILVNNVKDYAIFMLDTKGNIATWNAGATILKQYTMDEIVGKHFSIFYGKEDRVAGKPEKELELCLRQGKAEDEGWRFRKDGSKFWACVTIAPVYKLDTLIGFSKVTRDLTERRAAETRLIAAFEEASKLKSDFLANMSHEIRTPMHGMLAAAALLVDTGLSTEQMELANIIEDSGSVLLQVINDILDYSKLASGAFTVNTTAISITDIIGTVARCFQPTLNAGVCLETVLDQGLPKSTQSDPLRYRQVLQNLVGNAVKFTLKGYIRIQTSVLNEDIKSCTIMTEVIDTGIGVPSQAVSSLFNPFTQIDSSATKEYKGTGLGLSICKSLVELMGGTIGFRPNLNRPGSIFWFTTKLVKVAQESVVVVLPSVPKTELMQTTLSKHILVVEDNIINQKIMVKVLNGFGFKEVDVALNGAIALDLVAQKLKKYDLVLMDINMPVLDGIGATAEIRKLGLDMPVIAMTANALKGDQETYIAQGLTDYISKPVDRRVLLRALLKWLK